MQYVFGNGCPKVLYMMQTALPDSKIFKNHYCTVEIVISNNMTLLSNCCVCCFYLVEVFQLSLADCMLKYKVYLFCWVHNLSGHVSVNYQCIIQLQRNYKMVPEVEFEPVPPHINKNLFEINKMDTKFQCYSGFQTMSFLNFNNRLIFKNGGP